MLEKKSAWTTVLYYCTCRCFCGQITYFFSQWVHEDFACAALWTHSDGLITLASQCHPWQKTWPLLMGPHTETLPHACPAFFHTTVGLPYLGHSILLTRFCSKKILDLLLLSKLCGIVHGILAICLVRREQSDILGGKKNSTITLRNTFGTPVPLTGLW